MDLLGGVLEASWKRLGSLWRRLGGSWRRLGDEFGGLGGVLEARGGVLEAMLSQDRFKKAQDAKTFKKSKKDKVFWPPAEVSWWRLGGVLEALGGILEALGGILEAMLRQDRFWTHVCLQNPSENQSFG